MRHFRFAVLCVMLAMSQLPLSMAQNKPTIAPDAPIPAQILSAKKVFIANAGADQAIDLLFSEEPDRGYNEVYSAMKSWGRFDVVGSPAESDLLIEIRQYVFNGPQLRMKIRDPKTSALLWSFDLPIPLGTGRANSDRNFDQAIDRLVNDFRALVTRTPTPATSNTH